MLPFYEQKDAESPLSDLTEMQCLWFLLAEGDSYRRQGKLNLALKRYHTVEKVGPRSAYPCMWLCY